jgi:hypothetical protein
VSAQDLRCFRLWGNCFTLGRQHTTELAAFIGPITLTSFGLPCKIMHVMALYNHHFSLFMSSEGKLKQANVHHTFPQHFFNVLFIHIFGGFHSVEK